ncbi:hypothetical protein ACQR16_28425 [Bradyrhizobium oligotrophicum]|uniref:hypothetical protein n=1 Tax=Bradyrhizobium oligotrophicum TaxID=44255 RepID=UPI003EB9C1AA
MADIANSPRVSLETLFSISGYPWNRRFCTGEVISRTLRSWQPAAAVFPIKKRRKMRRFA